MALTETTPRQSDSRPGMAPRSLLTRLSDEFDRLGPLQGAVLTYAPYIALLMSEDPFEAF